MTRSRHRWFLYLIGAALAAALVGLGGCAGCGGDGQCSPPCPDGQVCQAGQCVRTDGTCIGGCAPGQSCQNGQCVWDNPQCQNAGEPCNRSGPVSDGFLCVPWSGDPTEARCAKTCGPDRECGDGAACVLLETFNDQSCQSSSDCPEDKNCSSGTCRFAVCRPSECEGFLAGDSTCEQKYGDNTQRYPNGAKCYPVRNGANYCLPAGRRGVGQSCTAIEQAIQNQSYTDTCKPGLAACSGDKNCVGVDSPTVRPGVGQCAATCTPFSEEACGEGRTCKPIAEDAGRCVEAGDKSAFATCDPGAGQCKKGLVCITHQAEQSRLGLEEVARCHPICDTSIGEPKDDGSLPQEALNKRDATCPQPDSVPAAFRILHVAAGADAVDVYRAGADMPLVAGLAAGASSGDGPADYETIAAGKYDFSALSEGAPPTDLPLAKWTERLGAGDGRIFVLAAPDPETDEDLRAVVLPAPEPSEAGDSEAAVRVAHTIPDTEALDVVTVPTDQMPGDPQAETVLAEGLSPDAVGDLTVLEAKSYDIYVFPAGADRSKPDAALLTFDDIALSSMKTLHLRGTLAPQDAYPNYPLLATGTAPKPNQRPDSPPMKCIASQDRPFGHCAQMCPGGAADYGNGVCDGDSMGCRPRRNQNRQTWEHRCEPVGDAKVGETCNPLAEAGQCAEGNYCLEYGNTRKGYQSGGDRGLCHSLCAVDGEGSSAFGCAGGESCKPLSYNGSFDVGECGIACEPDSTYTDESCPAGLKSCKPVASLQNSSSQGNTPPVVREEQAFCSASGDVSPGEMCRARNCRPKSECMFPRSRQQQLVQSLLSPYVGASGQTPSCKLRCDPFDGDDSTATCGEGETCLFNYPWSAEVGHCATIESRTAPGEPCETPGLSCGEDSICAARGNQTVCMRFCQYEGPDANGNLRQSTCPSGYKCNPFARDVGVCRQ
ncbi:MAG: DUF4397 domain-containing protein [Bradymonadaceae bacterium]